MSTGQRFSVVSATSNAGAASFSLFSNLEEDETELPNFSPFDKVTVVPQVDRLQSTAVTKELLQDEDYQEQRNRDKYAQRISLIQQHNADLKNRHYQHSTLDELDEPTSPMSQNDHTPPPSFQSFQDYPTASPQTPESPLPKRRSHRFTSPRSMASATSPHHRSSLNRVSYGSAQLIDTQSSGAYTLGGLMKPMLSPTGGIPGRMPSITEKESMEQIALEAVGHVDHQKQLTDYDISTMSKQTTDYDLIPIEAVNANSTTRSIQSPNNDDQLPDDRPHHQPMDTNKYKSEEFEQEQFRIMNRSDTEPDSGDNDMNDSPHGLPMENHIDNDFPDRDESALSISPIRISPPAEAQRPSMISDKTDHNESDGDLLGNRTRSLKLQKLSNLGAVLPPSRMQASVSQEHFDAISRQVDLLTKAQQEMQSMLHMVSSLEKTGKATPSVGSTSLQAVHPWAGHSLMHSGVMNHAAIEPSDGNISWGLEGGPRRTVSSMTNVSNLSSRSLGRRCKYDISFLVAQPLLHHTGSEWRPVETLDSDQEEKAIKEAFKTAGRKIHFIREFATVNNLRRLVTEGTQIIHYGGHGIRNALIFESDTDVGKSCKLPASKLKNLISAGKATKSPKHEMDPNLKLVFISACHSEDAGKAFMHAGAKHVVCVRKSQEMHDIAAGTFTYQFYFALVTGKTVQQSFAIAKQTIQAQFGDNSYLRNEQSTSIPNDPECYSSRQSKDISTPYDHDDVKQAPNDLNDIANLQNKNTNSLSHGVPLNTINSMNSINFNEDIVNGMNMMNAPRRNMRNIINHSASRGRKMFPAPPKASEWVGRYREMHDLMHDLLQDNLVVLWGSKGLGKTAMVLRTLHYLWDRHLMAGIYHFHIYERLKSKPSWSIAKIVAKAMCPEVFGDGKGKVTNEALVEALQQKGNDFKDREILIVFEDIDLFEYEHLAEDQRIDIFIEDVISQCHNVKLLVTMATKVRGTFLSKWNKRVSPQLKPLSKDEAQKLLEVLLMRDFSRMVIGKIPVDRIVQSCREIPHLIKFAATLLREAQVQIQANPQGANTNLWKTIREKISGEFNELRNERYWKELDLKKGSLGFGEIKKHIRQRSGQRLWEEMYSYKSRGVLDTFLWRMREWYREIVDDARFKMRPIWTYYELEFIQMELLPFLAEQTKQTFRAPKEVVRRLETTEPDVDELEWTNHGKKGKNDKNKKGKKKKRKWYTKVLKKDKNRNKGKSQTNEKGRGALLEEEDVPEVEKIPIEVFAEFYQYWRELWKTMREPKLSPFYFKKDREICLIAGMMRKKRAKKIISQFAQGTFLIRFSKRDAASLVLVVSNGVDQQPSEYKIRIIKHSHFPTEEMRQKTKNAHEVTFEYDTVRKGVQCADTLCDVIKEIHCVEYLWYQKRGKGADCVERDKRKVLKLFRESKDIFNF